MVASRVAGARTRMRETLSEPHAAKARDLSSEENANFLIITSNGETRLLYERTVGKHAYR